MPKKRNTLLLIPVFGTIIFSILYFAATRFYPGGSQADKNSTGFSWIHNYWCNLLNEKAVNGKNNPAQPIALSAMFILCLTLVFFWYTFPTESGMRKFARLAVQLSGAASMTIAFFLFTHINHDLIINLACGFGAVALIGTFAGLYKIKWYALFTYGLLNIVLAGINNYVYYHPELIRYLPVIQKITFALFLLWILHCYTVIPEFRNDQHTGARN